MANYLVTGGAGFIGSHIAEALVKHGHSVRVLDNFSTGHRRNLADIAGVAEIVEGDITNRATVGAAMQGIEFVFHEAAIASVPLSVERPLDVHAACATGTLNVLDAARRAGVRRLVYAASSSAYGNRPTSPKQETDQLETLSPYAAAKLAGEFYCQAFYHSYGLETVGLRYFNVFGPRQDPSSPYSGVISLFITAMLAGRSPTIFGDGLQTRDYVFVENVVQANLKAMAATDAAGQVFNVGNGRSSTVLELMAALNQILKTNIEPVHREPRVGDVRDSLANIQQARERLGYDPQIGFEEGLRRTVDFFRAPK